MASSSMHIHTPNTNANTRVPTDKSSSSSCPKNSPPPLRGNGSSDILAHLVPHLEKMQPQLIKQEIVRIVKDIIDKNKLNLQTGKSLLAKVEWVIKSNDYELRPNVVQFCLWLDRLVPSDRTYRSGNIFSNSASSLHPIDEIDSTSYGIVDCLHLDYKLNEFEISIRGTKALILVGPKHTGRTYHQVSYLSRNAGTKCSVWVDSGSVSGKIQWISGMHDSISIKFLDGSFQYYQSVYQIFPYLQSPMLQQVLQAQEKSGVLVKPEPESIGQSRLSELTGIPDSEIPWKGEEGEEGGDRGEDRGEDEEDFRFSESKIREIPDAFADDRNESRDELAD